MHLTTSLQEVRRGDCSIRGQSCRLNQPRKRQDISFWHVQCAGIPQLTGTSHIFALPALHSVVMPRRQGIYRWSLKVPHLHRQTAGVAQKPPPARLHVACRQSPQNLVAARHGTTQASSSAGLPRVSLHIETQSLTTSKNNKAVFDGALQESVSANRWKRLLSAG